VIFLIEGIEEQVVGTVGKYARKKKVKGRNITTDR
jgi:hypothetical protein